MPLSERWTRTEFERMDGLNRWEHVEQLGKTADHWRDRALAAEQERTDLREQLRGAVSAEPDFGSDNAGHDTDWLRGALTEIADIAQDRQRSANGLKQRMRQIEDRAREAANAL